MICTWKIKHSILHFNRTSAYVAGVSESENTFCECQHWNTLTQKLNESFWGYRCFSCYSQALTRTPHDLPLGPSILLLRNTMSLGGRGGGEFYHLLSCDRCYRVLSRRRVISADGFLSAQTHWTLSGGHQLWHQVGHLCPWENRRTATNTCQEFRV